MFELLELQLLVTERNPEINVKMNNKVRPNEAPTSVSSPATQAATVTTKQETATTPTSTTSTSASGTIASTDDGISKKKKKTKKRVRFSSMQTTAYFHTNKDADNDDLLASSSSSTSNLPPNVSALSHWKQQQRDWHLKGYDLLLQDAYTQPVQARLNATTLVPDDDYIRGLESYICGDQMRARERDRERQRHLVLDAAVRMTMERRHTPDQQWQAVAEIAQRHSRLARQWAFHMAQADAVAAQVGEQPELVQPMVRALQEQQQRLRVEEEEVRRRRGWKWMVTSLFGGHGVSSSCRRLDLQTVQ